MTSSRAAPVRARRATRPGDGLALRAGCVQWRWGRRRPLLAGDESGGIWWNRIGVSDV